MKPPCDADNCGTAQDVHVHKPTVLMLHRLGILSTSNAARAVLLAYWHLSAQRQNPCIVSCKRIAKELGADASAVRKALARWNCATRTGRNGERKRPWQISVRGTERPAPQKQAQNGRNTSSAGGREQPPRGTPSRVVGGLSVPPEGDVEVRPTTEKKKRKKEEKAAASLRVPRTHATQPQGPEDRRSTQTDIDLNCLLPELTIDFSSNRQQPPPAFAIEPDTAEVEKHCGYLEPYIDDKRQMIGLAIGKVWNGRHEVFDEAMQRLSAHEILQECGYVIALKERNAARSENGGAILTNRLKERMAASAVR